jgi:hypothetical protein
MGQPNPDYDREHWAIRVTHLKEEQGQPGVCYQGGVYDDDTVERARKRMPPRVFREQFGGDFVSYSGTVYDSTKVKRIKPFTIPSDWPIVIGYDHGASGRTGGNTAIMFIAYDNERPRNAYLFRLIYESGHGAKWYINEIRKRLWQPGEQQPLTYNIIVVDRSAKQVRIELALEGMANTTPPASDFKAKYMRMAGLIEEGRLYVFDSQELAPFWYEMDRYEWKEGTKATEPRGDNVQGPDDAMDGTGYGLLHFMPDPTDEVMESAAELRTSAKREKQTRLTLNEKRAWRQVHERREEWAEDDDPEIAEDASFPLDLEFEED